MSKIINFFLIPNSILFLKILFGSAIWHWFYQQFSSKYYSIFLAVTAILSAIHFGVHPTITFLLIAGSSFLFAFNLLKIHDYLLALVVGFISFVQLYTMIALVSTVNIAYYTTLTIFCLLATATEITPPIKLPNYLSKLNPLDWTLIFIALIFGSIPQLHWDAVQANLYIAKWYVLSNSLSPLQEGITSLFPQSAIVYYSLFYKIGGLKLLQLAFFLPFFTTLLFLKKIIRQANLGSLGQIILYLALSTPIMLFQASSGYYDNLVLLLILSSAYSLYYYRHGNLYLRCAVAAFLVGFASGSKYFPLVVAPLPALTYLFAHKISWRRLVSTFTLIILLLTPLSLWMIRAYVHTGSPVFPFFQSVFPTPKYWDATDHLEGNFMIQTTMSVPEWVTGGVFTYPFKSYFNSTKFIEGTRGYPGFIYLAFIPLQVFLLIQSLLQLLRNRRLASSEQLFLYSFFAYFAVGLAVRYYRYLWPFQFMWLLSSLPLLHTYVSAYAKVNKLLLIIYLLITPLGFINLIDYYRYYPLDKSKVFVADYYLNNRTDLTPMAYLNAHANSQDKILDSSKFPIHRLHYNPRVYQCSWYWMNWAEEIKNPLVLSNFRYLVVDDPVKPGSNYCSPLIEQALERGDYQLVYQDGTYTIYEKN